MKIGCIFILLCLNYNFSAVKHRCFLTYFPHMQKITKTITNTVVLEYLRESSGV
jgi:hypothetical protein